MRQVLRKGLKDIVVDEVPDPTPGSHQVLVGPCVSLISSGTETASIHQEGLIRGVAENPSHIRKVWDVMKMNGPTRTTAEVMAKLKEYAVLGYSGAGVVVQKHPTVLDLDVGDRVAYGGEGTGHGETIVTGRNLVARVPDAVSFEEASFTTLGSIALNSVRVSGVGIGDVVVVIGLGLVGQLVAQLARLQGAVVIATDLRTDRVALATQLGAQHGADGSSDVEGVVRSLTGGRGADCVIVAAAAKSAAPAQLALRLCRDRGRIVVVGAVELTFPWSEMYMKEIQLFMSRAYGPGSYDPSYEQKGHDYPIAYVRWTEHRNMEEFLRLLEAGQVNVAPLVSHRFPFADAPAAYETIMAPESRSLAVVLRYPRADEPAGPVQFTPTRRVSVASAPSRPAKVRVALVGAGNLARWAHLPVLKRLPDVALRAVYSANGARGKNYAMRFGAEYCTSDFDQILADEAVNLILILSRNQHHAAQAIAALEAGKDVFVEKPMALTVDECRSLVRAVEDTGRSLTVGFNRRFAPFYIEQKRALSRRQGPAVVSCRINSPGISGSYWMADPAIGGAILGEACHFTDLLYWLLESEPVRVSAMCLPRDVPDPVGENNLVASLSFADGSIANITYCTVGTRTSGGERVEAFAVGVGAIVEDFKWLQHRGAVRRTRSRWFAEKGYGAQLESFIGAIRHGNPPDVNVWDGARSTLVCLAMLESARTGSPVSIDLERSLRGDAAAGPSRL